MAKTNISNRTAAPQITAVMVTGKDPARNWLARASVESFKQQTYIHKDLLIVNDGGVPLLTDDHDERIRELMVPKQDTLGDLRNIGIDEAKGSWIMQWDDDDWSHPARMRYQMESAGDRGWPVLLRYQVRYSFTNNAAKVWKWNYPSTPGIPGTILHPRLPSCKYRSEGKAEDEHFLNDHFGDAITVLNNKWYAHYYIRVYHGNNTWDERHVMADKAGPRGTNNWNGLGAAARNYLSIILDEEYKPRTAPSTTG
jgi:glycosyltransferase involved in cell wall biosynthesis